MSFVISVYVPEGIVMASDSRQSFQVQWQDPATGASGKEAIYSDSSYKVFYLATQQTGIAAYGEALPGGKPIASFIERFAEESLEPEDRVTQVAGKVKGFFFSAFPALDTDFHVAGFEKRGKQSFPYVYHVDPRGVSRVNTKPDGTLSYGCTWGGQADVIHNLIMEPAETGGGSKKPPIVWDTFSIQDAIDFALFSVRTTIDTMRFQARPKTVGGAIDILLLTPKEGSFIQRKQLHGSNI